METHIITLSKEMSISLYNDAKSMLKDQHDFEPILDERLIDELFAREVVRYLSKTHQLEPNDFKRVDCILEDNTLKKVTFGLIKKTQDSKPTLTYGII